MNGSRTIRIALAGNPNAGKTSIFNALTGSRQHVGNYAGVTVEKREGAYDHGNSRYKVLDLPGTYNLTSYSPEERIAQAELVGGDIDVVVAVVDSTALRRSLVFVAQLMQLGSSLVLCLNMSDEARAAGQSLDTKALSRRLGFPVVETVGHRAAGIDELRRAIASAVRSPSRSELTLDEPVEGALVAIERHVVKAGVEARRRWVATKLLLEDETYIAEMKRRGPVGVAAIAEAAERRKQLEAQKQLDIPLVIMEAYNVFCEALLRPALRSELREDARARSDRIDAIVVNRVVGVPIFLAAVYLLFWLTFSVGEIPMGWIEAGFGWLGELVSRAWPEGSDSVLRSLIVDGVIGGVGGVLVFLPNVVLLFLGLAFLEDTGYMARAAFLMDRVMHRFGLHGRSFIPMMTGFGCSVPGIMATRTLENERDRLATMLVLPLMSCGARLTIWMLLIPAFFPPAWRAPMLWLIYVIGVALALALALLLRRSVLRGEDAPFVMELPPYRMPTLRAIVNKMLERSWVYVRKAGTTILAISILMWAAATYPKKESYDVDRAIATGAVMTQAEVDRARGSEDLRYSIAGRIGTALEPVLRPLGLDAKLATGLIGAFAAKEVFVAQMAVVYSVGEGQASTASLQEILRRDYSPLVGFCLMLFLLIATPCMATVAITRRESGSWKWAMLQLGGLTGIAYGLTLLVYQIGKLFV